MSWACDDCNRVFATARARDQHAEALGHNTLNYECDFCDHWIFPDYQTVAQHEADHHHHCTDCNRTFMNANNLRMHMNSRIHRGTSIQCPFCKTGYTTATGLAHHLEGGNCSKASFLNRDEVYRIVRAKDPGGAISKNLIGWQGSPTVTYSATDRAWNGDGWECYFCHREFNTCNGLNQHLNSPAHQQALYHCPNRNKCGREFKTLAAVMNHLESESCSFTRFENVQRTVGDIVSGNRLLTF